MRLPCLDKTDGGRKTVPAQEVADYIESEMHSCKSFLAVVNTKMQAKELFALVKESGCADFVYHLSTDMCPAHRRAKIEEMRNLLASGERVVCVSTRLIEAGVDVSFGGALRYLAGLDSIIQTAGRCNRNGELHDEDGNKRCGKVAIFSVENENLGSMEELKIGQEQMGRILREFPADRETHACNLIEPAVIEKYFTYFYDNIPSSLLEYSVKDKEASVLDMLSDNKFAIAEYERISSGKKWRIPYRQSFKTAWENFEVIADVTTGIIVQYGEGTELIGELCALEKREEDFYKKLSALLRRAQQYTVNVYANQLQRLEKDGIIFEVLRDSGIYALREEFYSKSTGLVYEAADAEESAISVLNF